MMTLTNNYFYSLFSLNPLFSIFGKQSIKLQNLTTVAIISSENNLKF